jgi:hypothetical protein
MASAWFGSLSSMIAPHGAKVPSLSLRFAHNGLVSGGSHRGIDVAVGVGPFAEVALIRTVGIGPTGLVSPAVFMLSTNPVYARALYKADQPAPYRSSPKGTLLWPKGPADAAPRLGELIDPAEPDECRGFRIGPVGARAFNIRRTNRLSYREEVYQL